MLRQGNGRAGPTAGWWVIAGARLRCARISGMPPAQRAPEPGAPQLRRPAQPAPRTSSVVQAARRSSVSSFSNMAHCSASVCSCVHRLQPGHGAAAHNG